MSLIAPMDLSSVSQDAANSTKAETLNDRAKAIINNASGKSDEALWKVATGFEEIFLNMILKSMRKTTMESGLIGGGNESKIYKDMFDSEIAGLMAGRKDMGMSKMIHDYLAEKMNGENPDNAKMVDSAFKTENTNDAKTAAGKYKSIENMMEKPL